jgi:hypothetical protein
MDHFSYCEQKAKFVSMEAKIMSNVPGWEAGKSVYHSERYVYFSLFQSYLFHAALQVGSLF